MFQQKYIFLKNPKFFDRYKSRASWLSTAIYLDAFGESHEWANSLDHPSLILLTHGKIFLKENLWKNFSEKVLSAEGQLQEALRIDDPGLPLPLLQKSSSRNLVDSQMIRANEVTLSGNWTEGKGTLMTEDSTSTLTTSFEGNTLRALIDLHPESRDSVKVQVTFNDSPIPENNFGPQLRNDDKGNTILEVGKSLGIYDIFVSPEKVRGVFKFYFLSVARNPILFYELRAGSV